jgi:hypothetical protein
MPPVPQPLLSEAWRDILTIVSLVITAAGFLGTVVGLVYAIRQIKQTKTAALAAKEASDRALADSRKGFHHYTAANAHRFVNEAKIHVGNESWAMAAMRLGDLADQLAQLGAEWKELVAKLREWDAACTRRANGSRKSFALDKWSDFAVHLQERIDGYYGPFVGIASEGSDDSD